MERKGFVVESASTVKDGIAAAKSSPPDYAVVDLRLSDGSGLDVVSALHEARQDIRVVMLTGFGAIASAVAAIKAGAVDYLPSRRMLMRLRLRSCRGTGPVYRRRLRNP